ncbi:MAG: bifunctional hydroxymethylpyrimidine kinase/phosphomethylpyrimidine kinase [Bacteroidales bacterium]|nr:bifunctional hydroxymethylpyrimidine kinase/phosphomethylpyrimidine kinase [Bacteroidales bacterium]
MIIISYPLDLAGEIEQVVYMLKNGVDVFHLRKPKYSSYDMERYLDRIPAELHTRITLHSHYHLVNKYELGGVHLNQSAVHQIHEFKNRDLRLSYSAHTYKEIRELDEQFDYFFLSPVFDSISKDDYQSGFSISELREFFKYTDIMSEVYALGGITDDNIHLIKETGFSGVAILGSIWKSKSPIPKFEELKRSILQRPFALSIAGFDPCSGAGVTADLKTMEQHKIYGLGVTTAITNQNHNHFDRADWLPISSIIQQIDILFEEYDIQIVKIGIIENLESLFEVICHLKEKNPEIKIIWDPVIKASSGYSIHTDLDKKTLGNILNNIYLVTPNLIEAGFLFGDLVAFPEGIQREIIGRYGCYVLIKGGHDSGDFATDILITESDIVEYKLHKIEGNGKHGTGCVLSSAIVANLALGYNIRKCCRMAKEYITAFILSNNSLLGYHSGERGKAGNMKDIQEKDKILQSN